MINTEQHQYLKSINNKPYYFVISDFDNKIGHQFSFLFSCILILIYLNKQEITIQEKDKLALLIPTDLDRLIKLNNGYMPQLEDLFQFETFSCLNN